MILKVVMRIILSDRAERNLERNLERIVLKMIEFDERTLRDRAVEIVLRKELDVNLEIVL